MSVKLVECIANFSEGRREEVVNQIEATIGNVSQVLVLDRHSDVDHNRSVISFAGPMEPVAEAAFQAIKTAADLIDLEEHKGEHPRIGATDVVPFVPLGESTMEECVDLARSLGRRVGEELGIPVYLYEEAALRPERSRLEVIRKGEYEQLKAVIGTDPTREPDFGPAELGSAGATVIGARKPLIAYNVYLTTEEVEVADRIARAVRHSSGGLRHVKALGMLVEGRAQVSMNLTDFEDTPIARVQELIRREAKRYGVDIHHAELVGLIPQAALIDAAQWYLQLDQFERNQVLETRLQQAAAGSQGDDFLDRLAAGTPTPGGGSAAAHSGAMGAALVGMVARLTTGKKGYEDVAEQMDEIADQADRLRQELHTAVEEDARAFDAVMSAFQLPKASEEERMERDKVIQQATHVAAEIPLRVAELSALVHELAAQVSEQGNKNAITDAAAGGAFAAAAVQAAGLNVRINASAVTDETAAGAWLDQLAQHVDRSAAAGNRIYAALGERAGLKP